MLAKRGLYVRGSRASPVVSFLYRRRYRRLCRGPPGRHDAEDQFLLYPPQRRAKEADPPGFVALDHAPIGIRPNRTSFCGRIVCIMSYRLPALLALAVCLFAQPKPTLAPADYGKWETPGQVTLAPDGKWVAYDIRRTDGNNELRVSPTAAG